jgi:hypothetical protein
MDRFALVSLFLAAAFRPRADDRTSGRTPRTAPPGFADLNDYYLRDIGFVREQPARHHDHLMWM